MCFSAPVTFAASAMLLTTGAASLAIAEKKERPLAVIPFFFGVQQFFEGLQWVSLNAGSQNLVAGYGFLFFALILWPLYAPIASWLLEKKHTSRSRILLMLGVFLASAFLWFLATHPLTVSIKGHSILYSIQNSPNLAWLGELLYIVIVCGTLITAKNKGLQMFGWSIGALSILTLIFSMATFVSMWCFISAVSSVSIYWYLRRLKKSR